MSSKFIRSLFAVILFCNMFAHGQVLTATAIPQDTSQCSTCGGTASWNLWQSTIYVNTTTPYEFSKTVFLSNFGFNIPLNATILGVELTVGTYTGNTWHFKDTITKLSMNSVPVGNNKAFNQNFTFTTTNVYGGPADLWGNVLTPSNINNPAFGVALAVKETNTFSPSGVAYSGLSYGTLPFLKIYYQLPVVFAPTFTLINPTCAGTQHTLTANTGTFSVSGYTWSVAPGGPTFSSPNSSTTNINYYTSGTYSVSLTASSGGTTSTSTQTVLVQQQPTITAVPGAITICPTYVATLTASGAPTYTWYPGNVTGSTFTVSPQVSTQYTVYGTSSLNCIGYSTPYVIVLPAHFLAVSASSPIICAGSSAVLTATSSGSTFTWNPGSLSGNPVTVTPTVSTVYSVAVSTNSCTTTKTISLNVSPCTGLGPETLTDDFYDIYPNPASDKLFLNIQTVPGSEVTIQFMNTMGNMIENYTIQPPESKSTATIIIDDWAPGLYFAKIIVNHKIAVIRFIKK